MGHFGYHPWLLKIPLLAFVQIGQLHSGIEGNFLFVHHVQQFGNEVCQADIASNSIATYALAFCDRIIVAELRRNLRRS